MDEIIKKLYKYFNKTDIEKLLLNLKENQKANIINNKYFAKIRKNNNNLFFKNLINERSIYINNIKK